MSATLQDPRIAAGLRAQMQLLQRRLAEGARQVGWKVGFGAPAAMDKLKLTAPLVGFLLDGALVTSGATVSLDGWAKPAAETEIAAHIGRDLGGGASLEDARAAIAGLGPAIELADIDGPMDEVTAVLAGDIFQRHVILGSSDSSRAGARLEGLTARVRRSGQDVPVAADLESGTGRIVDIVRHVADVAAAVGGGLRAGQFIICGSLTAPMVLEPARESGIDYELAPIGAISVKFRM